MYNNSNPIMILPHIEARAASTLDILLRLDSYAKKYQSLCKDSSAKLVVFASYEAEDTCQELQKKYEFLEIHAARVSPWRIFKHANLMRRAVGLKSSGPRVLIAGDPFLGFLIALLVKIFSRTRHTIQVQFHGEIYFRPKGIQLKRYLKWTFSYIQIWLADSIRVVSTHQIPDISKIAPFKNIHFVVAPIPIDDRYYSIPLDRERVSIGFIGRLHQERGIELLIEIISEVLMLHPGIKIQIIGDGPERKKIEDEFSAEIEAKKINLLGWSSKELIAEQLETMKLLLSTAPSEGYGLAIREAALAGVLVVAKSSGGAASAAVDFPEVVHLFKNKNEAIALINDLLMRPVSLELVQQLRSIQRDLDETGVKLMVSSWI
jgi:glycosyltransferase involved in cell wall biosynthesis